MGIFSQKPRHKKLNDLVYELYRPDNPTFDVVFFHGLQRDICSYKKAYVDAWMSSDGTELWPEQWLGKDLKTARVLSLSFDLSDLTRWGSSGGDANVYQIMEDVTFSLILDKNVLVGNNRPVILVGHSFGGIFVKELIVRSHHEKSRVGSENSNRLGEFLTNCKGIFFYSVPQVGLAIQEDINQEKEEVTNQRQSPKPIDLVRTVAIQAVLVVDDVYKVLRRLLKPERLPLRTILDINEYRSPKHLPKAYKDISTLLVNILLIQAARLNDDFNKVRRRISSSGPFRLGMIFEGQATDLGKDSKTSSRIVPQNIGENDAEEILISEADHFDVCKPVNRDDKRYSKLAEFISNTCETENVTM